MDASSFKQLANSDLYYDKDAMILIDQGVEVRLDRIVSKLLEYFLANENKVISREELLTEVWQNQQVSNDAINRAVSVLRKALGGKKHSFIETIPKVGYRFQFIPATQETPVDPLSTIEQRKPTNNDELALTRTLKRQYPTWLRKVHQHVGLLKMTALAVISLTGVFLLAIMLSNDSAVPTTPSSSKVLVEPFVSYSRESSTQLFVQGLTNEIENNLARLKGLFLISPQPSWLTKDNKVNRELVVSSQGADYLLAGNVQKTEKLLRVSIQLIQLSNNEVIFSHAFNRTLENFFTIQQEISRQVASALNVSLVQKVNLYSMQVEQLDFVSIEQLVNARALVMSQSPEEIKSGVTLLQSLNEKYNDTPEVLGLLAFGLYQLNSMSNISIDSYIHSIIDVAEDALRLDEGNIDALYTLANVYIGFPDWRNQGYKILSQLLAKHPGKQNLYRAMLYQFNVLNPSCRDIVSFLEELPSDILSPSEHDGYRWAIKTCYSTSNQKLDAPNVNSTQIHDPLAPEYNEPIPNVTPYTMNDSQLIATYDLYLPGNNLYFAVEHLAKQYPNPRYLAELYDYQLFLGAFHAAEDTRRLLNENEKGTWSFTTDLIGYLYGQNPERLPSDYLTFVDDAYRNASIPGFVSALIKEARETNRPTLLSDFADKIPEFPITLANRGESVGKIVLLREIGRIEESNALAQELLTLMNMVYNREPRSYQLWNMAPIRLIAALYADDMVTAYSVLEHDFYQQYPYWFNGAASSEIVLSHWKTDPEIKGYLQLIESDRQRMRSIAQID